MKKIFAFVFALIVATVVFGVTASAVEVTNPEIHTLQEIPALPTNPELPSVTTPEIPTATMPEIQALQEIPTVTTPEIPTVTIPSKPETTTNSADIEIPVTGSSVIIPVIALLAVASGATVAVKTKKED